MVVPASVSEQNDKFANESIPLPFSFVQTDLLQDQSQLGFAWILPMKAQKLLQILSCEFPVLDAFLILLFLEGELAEQFQSHLILHDLKEKLLQRVAESIIDFEVILTALGDKTLERLIDLRRYERAELLESEIVFALCLEVGEDQLDFLLRGGQRQRPEQFHEVSPRYRGTRLRRVETENSLRNEISVSR